MKNKIEQIEMLREILNQHQDMIDIEGVSVEIAIKQTIQKIMIYYK